MSIQTRSKRRDNRDRGSRSAKTKYESLFFSGALRRLQKSKIKKSREKVATGPSIGGEFEFSLTSGALNSSPCVTESIERGNDVNKQPQVRSSLFEKFKISKLSANSIGNMEKFLAFEYGNNDEGEKKFIGKDIKSTCQNHHDMTSGKVNCTTRPMFEDNISHDSKQMNGIEIFASEVLLDVKRKINCSFKLKDTMSQNSQIKYTPCEKIEERNLRMFEKLPKMDAGNDSLSQVKNVATEYLNSFLSTISISETQNNQDELLKQNPSHEMPTQFTSGGGLCFAPAINHSVQSWAESCSFGDSLCSEGYLSKPINAVPTCPWPTSDSCLLSNRVENRNGQIFVVKEKKKHQKREILADFKKKKRSLMLGHPPKYITPVEYHNRMLEHREHLERRQWQNIVYSQDYENLFHDKPPTKIPEYVYHNQRRHAQTSNSELLGYLSCRASLLTDDTWDRIEGMAQESTNPLPELSPFHIDHFFYQQFFFSTSYLKGMKRSKKRKRSNIYHYFQPELYILPPHLLPKHHNPMLRYNPNLAKTASSDTTSHNEPPIVGDQNFTAESCADEVKEAVPSLPEVPRASISSPSKSPELRAVENVYCYKRKSSN